MSEMQLVLFLGNGALSTAARSSVEDVCKSLGMEYHLEVVLVARALARARREKIFATPALVRTFPGPRVHIVGDLSNRETLRAQLAN